jgi:hypothetical protein
MYQLLTWQQSSGPGSLGQTGAPLLPMLLLAVAMLLLETNVRQ